MGGIYDAIAYAAKEANLTEYAIEELPVQKDFFKSLMEGFDSETKIKSDEIIIQQLGEFAALYQAWKSVSKINGIQARLPYFLLIR